MARGLAGLLQFYRRRPAAAAVVLCAAILGVLAGLFGYRLYGSIGQLRASVDQASAIIDATGQYVDAMRDAETSQRGYLLTMRPSYLEPFWNSSSVYDQAGARLEELTRGSPELQAETASLRLVGRQKMLELNETIRLAMRDGQQAALPEVLTDVGKAAMDLVRQHASRINEIALTERSAHTAKLIQEEQRILYAILLAAVIGRRAARSGGARSSARPRPACHRPKSLAAAIRAPARHGRTYPRGRRGVRRLGSASALQFGVLSDRRRPGRSVQPGNAVRPDRAGRRRLEPPLIAGSRAEPTPQMTEVRRGESTLQVWRSQMPDGGQMLGVADITRRVQAEAIARQSQKIEFLGQLTGGVAHDFNNLLQVVSANLELLDARPDLDASLRQRLGAAQVAVERGARLTRHLLAFARRQPLAPEAIDPGRLLNGMEDLLRGTLGSDVRVEIVVGGGLWPVRADPHQLENAVLNMCINARDAIYASAGRGDGRITIEAANAKLDATYVAANPESAVGQYVLIAISDTGTGMTAAQIARAVEPFYTTKTEGKGTGLGLSMVYGFVKQSGGHFKIYSEPDHGTTVKVYLPRTHVTPSAQPADVPAVAARAEGETVLVVEDEATVRAATVEALAGLGYRTLAAESSAAALALLEQGHRPDVLFTDVVMPGQPGARELAAQASKRLPELAVVFTSGYTANAVIIMARSTPTYSSYPSRGGSRNWPSTCARPSPAMAPRRAERSRGGCCWSRTTRSFG